MTCTHAINKINLTHTQSTKQYFKINLFQIVATLSSAPDSDGD